MSATGAAGIRLVHCVFQRLVIGRHGAAAPASSSTALYSFSFVVYAHFPYILCRRRHIPETANWLQRDTNAFIPWGSVNKRRLYESVIWDLFFPWKVYGWLREMGYSV
jgi:hypothetical protein